MGAYKDFSILPFGDSISRIRELENFLLRALENVDIWIEWVRIREFDSSGGRIELYCALVHSVLTMSPVVLQSLAERKRVKRSWFWVCLLAPIRSVIRLIFFQADGSAQSY